uniref:Uncharacterized protein n=1 Tax=Rhizophora mucronata TaxID=61149 RepID=A0A2P2M2X4_RHIMU
MVKLRTNG